MRGFFRSHVVWYYSTRLWSCCCTSFERFPLSALFVVTLFNGSCTVRHFYFPQLNSFFQFSRFISSAMTPRLTLRECRRIVWHLPVASPSRSVHSGFFLIPRVPPQMQPSGLPTYSSDSLPSPSATQTSLLFTVVAARPSSAEVVSRQPAPHGRDVVQVSAPDCIPARPPLRSISPTKCIQRTATFKAAPARSAVSRKALSFVSTVNSATVPVASSGSLPYLPEISLKTPVSAPAVPSNESVNVSIISSDEPVTASTNPSTEPAAAPVISPLP